MFTKKRIEVYLALAAQGVITICGKVDGQMVELVHGMLAVAESNRVKELTVKIQCNGGGVRAGLDIYDMIRVAPVEKRVGLVLGFARSMGAIILQACEERITTQHSRILIHYVSVNEVSVDVLKDPERLKKEIELGEREQNYLEAILMDRTKRSVEEIRAACSKDADMTSEEALAFGLIDTIRK